MLRDMVLRRNLRRCVCLCWLAAGFGCERAAAGRRERDAAWEAAGVRYVGSALSLAGQVCVCVRARARVRAFGRAHASARV